MKEFLHEQNKDGFQVEMFVGVTSIKVHIQLATLLIFEVASNFPSKTFVTNLIVASYCSSKADLVGLGAREARGL